ncbi:hypothetical protein [Lacrimispora sp. 38-1]|uniref:hypothetical protein n=1 Tax=Lacrimispora sp. 38-1 TaxID=3125778 RepID=UPI003CF1E83A
MKKVTLGDISECLPVDELRILAYDGSAYSGTLVLPFSDASCYYHYVVWLITELDIVNRIAGIMLRVDSLEDFEKLRGN